jgi:hypothetical protein
MTSTPLMDRILAAEQRSQLRYLRPAEPTPIRKARWLDRLTDKDTTELVLGSWIGPKDGSAA